MNVPACGDGTWFGRRGRAGAPVLCRHERESQGARSSAGKNVVGRGQATGPVSRALTGPRGARDQRLSPKGALQAVEDQVESELELVAEVVAGLENVAEGELREVGVLVSSELRQDGLGQVGDLLWSVEG